MDGNVGGAFLWGCQNAGFNPVWIYRDYAGSEMDCAATQGIWEMIGLKMGLAVVLLSAATGKILAEDCAKNPTEECSRSQFRKMDLELNRVYGKLVAILKKDSERMSLRKSQRVWVKFRDASCDFESKIATGTGTANGTANGTVAWTECLTRTTAHSILDFTTYLKRIEGPSN